MLFTLSLGCAQSYFCMGLTIGVFYEFINSVRYNHVWKLIKVQYTFMSNGGLRYPEYSGSL